MSDEGMSGFGRFMDDDGLARFRASSNECDGHDICMANNNSLRRIIARLDAAEREQDALREALACMVDAVTYADAETLAATPWMYRCTDDKLTAARAALTANHSATVVEE